VNGIDVQIAETVITEVGVYPKAITAMARKARP